MLCYEDITFRYRKGAQPVLQHFDWRVPAGRTVLLGPNGAGKSTLLTLGASARRPAGGCVRIGRRQAGRRSDRAAYLRCVSWMPQHISAIPGLSVREQVAYVAWLKGLDRTEGAAAADSALARVDLLRAADQSATALSGGQLRRVGLAQALLGDPSVLLLDEPTAGLDPAQRSRFRSLLADVTAGSGADGRQPSVVVSTHQVDDLDESFDNVVVLLDGRIGFQGTVADFLALAPADADRPAEAAYAVVGNTAGDD